MNQPRIPRTANFGQRTEPARRFARRLGLIAVPAVLLCAAAPAAAQLCFCPGDFDRNSVVNVDDRFDFVRALLDNAGAGGCADINGDGFEDGRDIGLFVARVLAFSGFGTLCPGFGMDAFTTLNTFGPEGLFVSFYEFGGPNPPIPAGFFGPGSDPFTGVVELEGVPLNSTIMGPTDTLVRRPPMTGNPAGETVPVELVSLSLHSISPITVTYNGGMNPEQWHLGVGTVDTPAPPGILTVMPAPGNFGGTFTATIFVRPLFIFVRLSPKPETSLDEATVKVLPEGDMIQIQFNQPQPFSRQLCPQVQQDRPFVPPQHGAPFIPGIHTPFPGQCFKPGPMPHVTPGEAHYVAPPNRGPPGGVTRCTYNFLGQVALCPGPKVGMCPPAPPVLCTRICPPVPCPPALIRIVKITCRLPGGGPPNRGFCVQVYLAAVPACQVCP